ncbi:pancreatic triacylglycerol lipase-like isoform X2 [Macrosteles quadrilineatus]|uniref:pancreatic triacylglycerol lipase-like isoform X2 n=1 Tax=Macrosteles quadrilineatus TaxID=74068 RepID=UPI0023E343E2|nr:pancreatic triacylglycerol lipase-like isoform X2 [Macrosteles quadrilineatus]
MEPFTRANGSNKLGYISPVIWIEEGCNAAYAEWQNSYVQNASLYTSFLLFTRHSTPEYTVIDVGNSQSLIDGGFNVSKETKIVVHGWLDNGTIAFAQELTDAYLAAEDVNVVAVNWPELSMSFYPLSASAIIPVGQYTASFVDFLVMDVNVDPDLIHLVGHSLGAHVAGVTGEFVTFGNLSRVTGLDPAAPMITSSPAGRLDPTDADFVDVIHTTGDYLGVFMACGDVDFYPNGGTPIQPGCGLDVGFCSHRRAYRYFAESITSADFVATACDKWSDYKSGYCKDNATAIMGELVSTRAQGTFYLYTNSTSPFAMGNVSYKYYK